MLKKLTVPAALAVCIAFGSAGCGEDSTDTSPTPAVTTRQRSSKAATPSSASRPRRSGLRWRGSTSRPPAAPSSKTLVFDGVLPAVEKSRSALAALPAPAGDEAGGRRDRRGDRRRDRDDPRRARAAAQRTRPVRRGRSPDQRLRAHRLPRLTPINALRRPRAQPARGRLCVAGAEGRDSGNSGGRFRDQAR